MYESPPRPDTAGVKPFIDPVEVKLHAHFEQIASVYLVFVTRVKNKPYLYSLAQSYNKTAEPW